MFYTRFIDSSRQELYIRCTEAMIYGASKLLLHTTNCGEPLHAKAESKAMTTIYKRLVSHSAHAVVATRPKKMVDVELDEGLPVETTLVSDNTKS